MRNCLRKANNYLSCSNVEDWILIEVILFFSIEIEKEAECVGETEDHGRS